MRCPFCKSLSTKRNGKRELLSIGFDRKTTKQVQRYQCKECKRTFSKRRDSHKQYSSGFKRELVRMHIEERMSFRVISKRLRERFEIKASPSYLCLLFNETIKSVKGSKQIKEECQSRLIGRRLPDSR